jgi:hypothetical protein
MSAISIAPPADTVVTLVHQGPGAEAEVAQASARLLSELGEGLDALSAACRRAVAERTATDAGLQSVEWLIRALNGTLDDLRDEMRRLAG